MIWWGGKYPELDRASLRGGSMASFLGIKLVGVGDNWLKGRMPVDERTLQPFGRLHGGASMVLAETVGSVAGGLVVDPEQFLAVGMEINGNHLRPAFDGFVFGTATAESLGKTVQVWTVRIEDEGGRLICLSRFTVAVIPRSRA